MLPSYLIKDYLSTKFPLNKIIGDEFTTNSIFTSDTGMHMSVNTETGLWQDFKSQQSGNFPQLISYVEDISYDAALQFLRSKLFDSPETLFEISSIRTEVQNVVEDNKISSIVKTFSKFDYKNINEDALYERLARNFVVSRKLTKFDFLISKNGRYVNRLIIPYSYPNSGPYYFQARNLSLLGVKYLNPSKHVTGVKSSDILFPFVEDSDYVFITEGPLDAISLQLNGLNATCTQGCKLSHSQADQIKDKQIIFAYDNDEAGREGIKQARSRMLDKNVKEFALAELPDGAKDWNDLHVKCETSAEFVVRVRGGLKKLDFEQQVIEGLR
jgi:hypothetical protein